MGTINRKMETLNITFDALEDESKITVGHNKCSGHLVFDTLMTLERKHRCAKDGHRTPEP